MGVGLASDEQVSDIGEEAAALWMSVMLDFHNRGWHDLVTAGFYNGAINAGEQTGFVWMLERRSD